MNRISFYHASKTFSNILKKNYISFKSSFLADLFLYYYESEFLQKLVKDKKIHEARAFNFTYIAEFLPLIYPPELEVKETTDTASSASFLDLYFEFDDSGQIRTKIYDKRDDFNFKIINFPICAAIYQLLLHMVFTTRNSFVMQGPVAIFLIS